ncbi:MAG TPA: phosphoserine phosphatase SerB [Alphaproteobacteria bacterium]|nr:phosphoserine phosphatase SerB [Alphaproteobacteria bacterium]
MRFVLSLIAASGGTLANSTAELAADEAARAAPIAAPVWLAPSRACDIAFDGDPEAVAKRAHAALDDQPVDVNVVPAEGRRKKMLVADMESTIIENEMLDELADFVGARDRVADITRRAMNGELDFAAAVRERVVLLRGLPESVLNAAMQRVRIMPGAPQLVATMRAHGAYTALVSGGFTWFTGRIKERLGFDTHQANELVVLGGHLMGRVAEPILGREAKEAALRKLAGNRGLTPEDAVTVGDGANDLPMLKAAGLGVAFHAKPAVAAAAKIRIIHGDLRSLLYLQGYRDDEIVSRVQPSK